MSETISTEQPSAGVAGIAKDERLHLVVKWGIVFALALAVVLLRLQRLDELPPGLVGDENRDGVGALRILQGEHAIFFPDVGHGREPSALYAIALSTLLFGRTLLAIHLPTALGSAGMVFATFWIGRLFFGRDEESGRATQWRGLLVGGVGAGLMAVSIGQVILGRTAYNRQTHMPVLLTLCLGLLWWGWKERSWWRVIMAGACAGLLPYTYPPARFVPLLFLFFGLSFLLPLSAATRARVRAELPWAGAFLGAAGLVAAPLLVYFALHPAHFFLRSKNLWVFDPVRSQGNPLGTFLFNVWDHLLVLGFRGDPSWRNNFAGQPMLSPGEAFFFWLGVGMAVWLWQRRPTYRLLLLWLGVLILPATLALDQIPPSTMRMIGAAPAIYLLVGVGMWEAFQFLRERCLALPWRASLIFQENNTRAAIVVGAVVIGLILVQGVSAYRTYFHKWAFAPEVAEAYGGPWVDLPHALNAQQSAADTVYLIPSSHGHYSFEYLYQGVAPTHIFHMANPGLAQKISSALAAQESVSTVKLVEWKTYTHWLEDDVEPFDFLLRKYGRYVDSDEVDGFRVHNYVDIFLARPWTFYDYLEPLTVHYDGGISLHGLALGQGEEQLSTRQPLPLGRERSLWGVLQWQTSPGLDIDYAISLRLYNAAGEMAHQADDVLWKPTNHSPTSQWPADEEVESLFHLDLPGDLLSGEYELRMVVYNFETQAPTVQVGVWEPEVVLARLRLAEGR